MSTMAKTDPTATRAVVERYLESVRAGQSWRERFSDDIVFTSRTSPVRQIAGLGPFVEATKRFYSTIKDVEIRGLMVDGDRACALTRYVLQPPVGPAFESDVAEIFTVRDGKIANFDIYFDSAPYPK